MRTYRDNSFLRKKHGNNVGRRHRLLIFVTLACLFLSLCGVSSAQTSSGTPALSVSSTSINFGNVAVGQTANKTVTLTSTGTAPCDHLVYFCRGLPSSVPLG